MKEEYYLIKKDALDAICSHLKQTLEIPVNNDCKLIDLSDEAIKTAVELDSSKVRKYDDGFDRGKGYKQALTDIKQQIK